MQYAVGGNQQSALPPTAYRLPPTAYSRPAFTLIELLVTITIIGMLAGMMLGALQMSREAGREAATKATIAKLNNIIMQRYESYRTRRIPIQLTDPTGKPLSPIQAAQDRLYAIRDIMRMEMPDRGQDITANPIILPNSQKSVPRPALSQLYLHKLQTSPPSAPVGGGCAQAEMLYLIVSTGSPEAMEQFNSSEIADTDKNGWPEFVDGWGRPIFFLRWAPGYSKYSDIQVADPIEHHDPFDTRHIDSAAYALTPLIYSGGPNSNPGLNIKSGYDFTCPTPPTTPGDMFLDDEFLAIGTPLGKDGVGNITNHHIEQR